jgi:hypothetical protein
LVGKDDEDEDEVDSSIHEDGDMKGVAALAAARSSRALVAVMFLDFDGSEPSSMPGLLGVDGVSR